MEEALPPVLAISIIVAVFVIVLMMHRGRLKSQIMDLNRLEMQTLLGAKEADVFHSRLEGAKPQGKPLFKKGVIRRVRVYENGIVAAFGRIGYPTWPEYHYGFSPVAVLRSKRRFVPFTAISGIFPIEYVRLNKTINISKRPRIPVYREHTDKGIQIETKDLATAVMLQKQLLKWRGELGAFEDALRRAMGPRWYDLYWGNETLRGLEFIKTIEKEYEGVDEDGDTYKYTGVVSRSQFLLMDLHKHEFLRKSPGYKRARRLSISSLGADRAIGRFPDWLS